MWFGIVVFIIIIITVILFEVETLSWSSSASDMMSVQACPTCLAFLVYNVLFVDRSQ